MAEIDKMKKIAIFSAISAYLILKRRREERPKRAGRGSIRSYWRLSRIRDLMREDVVAGY